MNGSRMLIVGVVLAFVVGLTPCGAQSLPPGSYKQSCKNIEVRGGVLHAECHGPYAPGHFYKTSISIAECRDRDIENYGGKLRCGAAIQPEGPYLKTCTHIRFVKHVQAGFLSASCPDSKGRLMQTMLMVPCRSQMEQVYNEDGKLVCKS